MVRGIGRVGDQTRPMSHHFLNEKDTFVEQNGKELKARNKKSDIEVSTVCSRSLRNRKFRRVFHDNHQPKRLFTPEIKRYLKGWLVRRRKNPYPSRSEKKDLAFKTGLTYVQICNWFANWRRKLKNSSRSRESTWGNLIKGYNINAKGNVEQFSICSDDSIWQDANYSIDSDEDCSPYERSTGLDHSYFTQNDNCSEDYHSVRRKGKELYSDIDEYNNNRAGSELLSRWLESAAKYKAGDWGSHPVSSRPLKLHTRHREELDAAEALTFLSTAAA